MNEEEVKERMVIALKIAKKSWEEAGGMPEIFPRSSDDTGKIAFAILAAKIFDQLNQK
ncbi:MAG: hypothetical protein HZC03_01665 [Candidatus Lloydbacteria bacterium]|nr:hypothetical protein [Candidatus Lloydbacteria bacterium]